MKKKIIILCLFSFLTLFGEVKDNLQLFNESEISLINEKIKSFKDKNDIDVFLNTSNYSEGEDPQKPERTIIINLEKSSENKLIITENFTQDLGIDQYEEDLNSLIEGLSTLVESEDYVNYVIEFLDGTQSILDKRTFVEGETFQFADNKWEIIKWIAVVLTFLNILGRIRYVSKMKKAKHLENKRKDNSKKNWKKNKKTNKDIHHKDIHKEEIPENKDNSSIKDESKKVSLKDKNKK